MKERIRHVTMKHAVFHSAAPGHRKKDTKMVYVARDPWEEFCWQYITKEDPKQGEFNSVNGRSSEPKDERRGGARE